MPLGRFRRVWNELAVQNDSDLMKATHREERIRLLFKRQAHLYSGELPSHEDELAWLSLMQHHGAPTRLLDWTYSVLVAAYFAVESKSSDSDPQNAIWEIDTDWLAETCDDHLTSKGLSAEEISVGVHVGKVGERTAWENFKNLYLSNSYEFVRLVTPYTRNERIVAQQGVFTCTGDPSVSCEDNFRNMIAGSSGITKHKIPDELRMEFLEKLFSFNVGSFSLFPGLDGFSIMLGKFHPNVWL